MRRSVQHVQQARLEAAFSPFWFSKEVSNVSRAFPTTGNHS